MNREIKFRVFLKEWDNNGKMFYDCLPNGSISNWLIAFDNDGKYDGDFEVGKDIELMQYTGLRDKNGKEIYEGDIIKGKNLENYYEVSEVQWDYVQWYPLAGHRAFDECEVIGNIYENPELLGGHQ